MADASSRTPVYVGRQRQKGLWQRTLASGEIRYEIQTRIGGKPKRVGLEARNVTDAVEAAAVFRGDKAKGEVKIADRTTTFAQLVAQYLDHAASRIADSTHDLYAQRLRTYAVPTLGRLKVSEIETAHIRDLLDRLRDGRIRGSRGVLGGAAQQGVLVALGALFRFAKKQKLVARSPLADLDRDDKPSAARKRQPRYLTPEQIEALLAAASDH